MVLRLISNAVAIWLAAVLVHRIHIVDPPGKGLGGKILVLLGIAVVFGLVNAVVKPIVKMLSLPLVILSLGLFLLVINALMLWLTAWVTESTQYGLRIGGFWAAFFGAIIVTVVNWVLGVALPEKR